MNKSWLNIKKYFITFTLILSMTIVSLFSGCFSYSEDGEGLNDILYGVRMTYSKANLQESGDNITSSKDEDYVKDLMAQYLNISVEILTSLCSRYGKGVTDFSLVANNIPSDYGQVTITEIKFCESLDSSSENYLKMISESGRWEWANNLSSSASQNRFASDFCSSENLFKMQAALYSINMGLDCSGPNYNGNDALINDSPSLETIKKFANDFRVTHSGLIESEQQLLKEFILNNVIGSAYYQEYASDIENMVKEIFAQTVGTGKNGEEIYKYPVVVSAMVKDYNIKDIAIDSGDEDSDKDVDYFTMELGHQYYKSAIFMPKKSFQLSGVYLVFESDYDMILNVRVRLHEKGSDTLILDEKLDDIEIHAGKYSELEEDKIAELEVSIDELLEKKLGITEKYIMNEYNADTDVKCYGGIGGTGIGDGTFDKFGRALSLKNEDDDVTLASFYKISKEKQKGSMYANTQISFVKLDSSYLEICFDSLDNKPFNIGFVMFDYDVPE